MKIKIDYGTKKSIPNDAVNYLNAIVSAYTRQHHLQVGKCTVYVNLYDEEGRQRTIGNDDQEEIVWTIRDKPYSKAHKDKELHSTITDCDHHIIGYVYYEFTKG